MVDNPETNTNAQQNIADAIRADNAQLTPEMADALTRLYWQRRLEYQLGYYRKKVRDFEDNVDNAFRLGAILMTVASLLAALGVFVQNIPSLSSLLALATAMIPAAASYITAFRQLYNWDRQLTIYRDTQLSLEGAKLLMPDLDALTPDEAHKLFPQLVQQVEGVIEKEAAQWGQIAVGKGEDENEAKADFEEMFGVTLAESSGAIDQEKLGALSNILESSTGTPKPGQYNLRPDELETRSPLIPDNFYGDSADEVQQRRNLAMAAAQQSTSSFDSTVEPPTLPVAESTMDYTPDLSDEMEMSYSPEMDADMQALVGTDTSGSSPELDADMAALVGTASPELDPELQALVGTASPELDPELQALVGTASPELDPELQALVGTASPELDPDMAALVGTASPELDPELQALVGTASPELDPELQALVGTDTPDIPEVGDDGSVG